MKMSELLVILNNMDEACAGDPEVLLQSAAGIPVKLHSIKAEGTCDMNTERGVLSLLPEWAETVTLVVAYE